VGFVVNKIELGEVSATPCGICGKLNGIRRGLGYTMWDLWEIEWN
jgi:hypothetical protein